MFIIKLCRSRYRFLIPPPSVLLFLAKQNASSGNPIFNDLNEIIRYSRECMLDPGISRVIVDIESKASIEAVYHLRCLDKLIDFLANVWDNKEKFSDHAAEKITAWLWTECIPPVPTNLSQEKWDEIVGKLDKRLVQKVFKRVLLQKKPERINRLIHESFKCLYPKGKEWLDKLYDALEEFWKKVEPYLVKKIGKQHALSIKSHILSLALEDLEDCGNERILSLMRELRLIKEELPIYTSASLKVCG